MPGTGSTEIVTRPDLPSRLGRLRIAGRIVGNRGLGRGEMWVYPEYALVYVTAGSGVYADPTAGRVPVRAGSLLTIVPGVPHWYGPPAGRTWDETFLVFAGPVFDLAARERVVEASVPVQQLEPVAYWADRLDGFRRARPPRSAAAVDDEACRLLQLLLELQAAAAPAPSSAAPPSWLSTSREVLSTDLAAPLLLSSVAAQVDMAYETWRRRFTRAAGTSPGRYRAARRIAAVEDLLRYSTLTQRQIAEAVGYVDEHHLSRRFREATGRSPRAYRASLA